MWFSIGGIVGTVTLLAVLMNPVMSTEKVKVHIPVDVDRLKIHVETLCSIDPPRSHAHPASLLEAATYIERELRKHTDRVTVQEFDVNGVTYQNVSALFGPQSGSRLVVGAHYDVCGDQPGADDNASGVAGLLEIAALLNGAELRRPIELVAYTLEEPPHFRTPDMGSARHAKKLLENKVPVVLMISLECIGYYSSEENSQDYPVSILKWFYPSEANFITVVGNLGSWGAVRHMKSKMREVSDLRVESINAPAWLPGIDFSDQLNYWKYGMDAVMISNTAFYRNANYHEPGDVPATLDYAKMAEVVKGVYWAVVNF